MKRLATYCRSAPTNDYYSGHRYGNNLFTGKPGLSGRHDRETRPAFPGGAPWTGTTTSCRADARHDRGGWPAIDAVMINKRGRVFDRRTGQPVWPIEERPVPQTVAGEGSPT